MLPPLLLLLAFKATRSLAYTPDKPVTVPLTVRPFGTEDQPDNAIGLAFTADPAGVDQLKLSVGGDREMYVTWHTGRPFFQNASAGPPTPPNTAAYQAEVSYGLHTDPTGHYEKTVTDCEKTYYIQDYSLGVTAKATFQNPTNYYVSQTIVRCKLTNLLPKTKYYYRCGSKAGYSVEYTFVTPPALGPNFPVRMGVIADVGNTQNSTTTLQHLAASQPDFFTIIGDLTYADRYTSLEVANIFKGATLTNIPNNQTFQGKWDDFGHQLQSFANSAQVPVNVLPGNHDIERSDLGTIFTSITTRFPNPYKQSNSTNPTYYSFNYGGVHVLMLNAYEGPQFANPYAFPNGGNYPQTIISPTQLAWIQADLAKVDRSVTPWVVAQMHPPWYNSYVSHYKEDECLQQYLEDTMYAAGVDIFRTNRVYKWNVDPCGPIHVTLGDAGNIEYGIRQYADLCNSQRPVDPTCSDASGANRLVNAVPVGSKYCVTYQTYPNYPPGYFLNATAGGYYVQSQQPPWSAYRDPSFGHAIIDFKSSTEAVLSWKRNQDGVSVVADSVTITRDPSCPNQKGGFNNPPPVAENPITHVSNAINNIIDGTTVNRIVNHLNHTSP